MKRVKRKTRYYRYNWKSESSIIRDGNGNVIYYYTWKEAVQAQQPGEQIFKEEFDDGQTA